MLTLRAPLLTQLIPSVILISRKLALLIMEMPVGGDAGWAERGDDHIALDGLLKDPLIPTINLNVCAKNTAHSEGRLL